MPALNDLKAALPSVPSTQVHQVVWGQAAAAPLAASLAPEELAPWSEWMADHPALTGPQAPTGRPGLGTPDLVYLTIAGQGVLARRAVRRDRTLVCHILLFAADEVDAHLALGLHDWDGWLVPGPWQGTGTAPLSCLSTAELRKAAVAGLERLRERARALPPEHLTALVAAVLDDPAGRYAAVGTVADPPALLCGLLDITGGITGQASPSGDGLWGPSGAGDRTRHVWTFATRQANEPATEQPRVVVVPATAARPPHPSRRRIHLDEATPMEETELAACMVGLYQRAGADEVHALWPPDGVPRPEWYAGVTLAPGVLGPMTRLLTRAASGVLSEAEKKYLASTVAGERAKEIVPELDTAHLTRLMRGWPERSWPAVTRLLQVEAVTRCLRTQPGWEELLEATARLAGSEALVRSSLAAWWREQKQRPPVPERLTRLRIALALGLLPRAGDPLVRQILSDLSTVELVRYAAVFAERDPVLAGLLLDSMAERPRQPAERAELGRILDELDYLVPTVERIAAERPQTAVRHYKDILAHAYGASLPDVATARAVLARAAKHYDPVPTSLVQALLAHAPQPQIRAVIEQATEQATESERNSPEEQQANATPSDSAKPTGAGEGSGTGEPAVKAQPRARRHEARSPAPEGEPVSAVGGADSAATPTVGAVAVSVGAMKPASGTVAAFGGAVAVSDAAAGEDRVAAGAEAEEHPMSTGNGVTPESSHRWRSVAAQGEWFRIDRPIVATVLLAGIMCVLILLLLA